MKSTPFENMACWLFDKIVNYKVKFQNSCEWRNLFTTLRSGRPGSYGPVAVDPCNFAQSKHAIFSYYQFQRAIHSLKLHWSNYVFGQIENAQRKGSFTQH